MPQQLAAKYADIIFVCGFCDGRKQILSKTISMTSSSRSSKLGSGFNYLRDISFLQDEHILGAVDADPRISNRVIRQFGIA